MVNNELRRKKQQELVAELLERKIRLHARHLYEQRGQVDGHALQDWVQAESEVLGKSIMAPFYRRTRNQAADSPNSAQLAGRESNQ